jgi:hypothetical protein
MLSRPETGVRQVVARGDGAQRQGRNQLGDWSAEHLVGPVVEQLRGCVAAELHGAAGVENQKGRIAAEAAFGSGTSGRAWRRPCS